MLKRVTCRLPLVSDIRTHRVQSSENKFIVLRSVTPRFPPFFVSFAFFLSFRLGLSTAIRKIREAVLKDSLPPSCSVQRAKKRRTMENRGETVEKRGGSLSD